MVDYKIESNLCKYDVKKEDMDSVVTGKLVVKPNGKEITLKLNDWLSLLVKNRHRLVIRQIPLFNRDGYSNTGDNGMVLCVKKFHQPTCPHGRENGYKCGKDAVGCLSAANRMLENYIKKGEVFFKVEIIGTAYAGTWFGKMFSKDFVNIIIKNRKNYSILEQLPEFRPFRVFFDIDGKPGDEKQGEVLNRAKKVIRDIFGEDVKMAISNSSGMKVDGKDTKPYMKYSYHIVLWEIGFKNLAECIESGFTGPRGKQGAMGNFKHAGIDGCLYCKNHAIRCVNSAKADEIRAKNAKKVKELRILRQMEDMNIEHHLIQGNFTISAMNFADKFKEIQGDAIKIMKARAARNGTTLPADTSFGYMRDYRQKNDDGTPKECPLIDFEMIYGRVQDPKLPSGADQLLALVPNHSKYQLSRGHFTQLMVTYKRLNGTWEGWLKWEATYDIPFQSRSKIMKSDWDSYDKGGVNEKWNAWGFKRLKAFLECFWGVLNEPVCLFKQQTIDNDVRMREGDVIVGSQYITLDLLLEQFRAGNKKLLIRANMGSGKTYAVIEWIKTLPPGKKILYITPRITLAYNLHGRINTQEELDDGETEGTLKRLGFKNYKTLGKQTTHFKQRLDVGKQKEIRDQTATPYLILGVHSLCMAEGNTYDIVIFDELETILNCFANEACHIDFDANYRVFEHLIRNAEYVLGMDAFLMKRSRVYLDMVIKKPAATTLITRSKKMDAIDKVVEFYPFKRWVNKIGEKLKAGKKCYVFYPFAKDKGNMYKKSIQGLRDILARLAGWTEEEAKQKAKIYFGMMSSLVKRSDMEDVNNAWSGETKLVITTNTISVGVNYDNKNSEFDCAFIGYAIFLNPADTIQALMRIRRWKEKEVNYCWIETLAEMEARKKKVPYDRGGEIRPKLDVPTEAFNYLKNSLMEEHHSKGGVMMNHYFKLCGFEIGKRYFQKFTEAEQVRWTDTSGNVVDNTWEYENAQELLAFENAFALKAALDEKLFAGEATEAEKRALARFQCDIAVRKAGENEDYKTQKHINWESKKALECWNRIIYEYLLEDMNEVLHFAVKLRRIGVGEVIRGNDLWKDGEKVMEGWYDMKNRLTYNTDELSAADKDKIFDDMDLGIEFKKREYLDIHPRYKTPVKDYTIKKKIAETHFGCKIFKGLTPDGEGIFGRTASTFFKSQLGYHSKLWKEEKPPPFQQGVCMIMDDPTEYPPHPVCVIMKKWWREQHPPFHPSQIPDAAPSALLLKKEWNNLKYDWGDLPGRWGWRASVLRSRVWIKECERMRVCKAVMERMITSVASSASSSSSWSFANWKKVPPSV